MAKRQRCVSIAARPIPNGLRPSKASMSRSATASSACWSAHPGCGKSTLQRMVASLKAPSAAARSRSADAWSTRGGPADRDIAMVFQNYALYPHMSVYSSMAYGLRNRGMPKPEIDTRVPGSRAHFSTPQTCTRPQARPAIGWPTPARRDGSSHRAAAESVPVRRTVVQPSTPSSRSRCGSRSANCSAG